MPEADIADIDPAFSKSYSSCRLAVLAAAWLALAPPPAAGAAEHDGLSELGAGTLLLSAGGAAQVAAPLLDTEIDLEITGPIARVTVRQVFANPGEVWAEGVYAFPLPDDAAVDRLRMVTADRVVEGEIREREEAKRAYRAARAEGRRASLVAQQRPNVFTTRLANLGPREEIAIEIEYQQKVGRNGDTWQVRVPLTITPRFDTGGPGVRSVTTPASASGSGLSRDVDLFVDLAPGMPLEWIDSLYHDVTIRRAGDFYDIRLADGPVPANRDFVLEWRARAGTAPRVSLFSERTGGEEYGVLIVAPPALETAERRHPSRDVIFVIDTSGSMAGGSIRQARTALWLAVERLDPEDHFNVIRFDDEPAALFPSSRAATSRSLEEARTFIEGMTAAGGTRMLPALEMALARPAAAEGRIPQIVFLTDGAVCDDDALFRAIQAGLGDARIFPVGIGSAPNTHFMRKVAAFGRGTFTHIGDISEVEEAMGALFEKLESVCLSELDVAFGDGLEAEILPRQIPDLYTGEPLVLALRAPVLSGVVHVSGYLGDTAWEQSIELISGSPRHGVSALWGRRRISELVDAHRLAATEEERRALRQEIVEVGLAHHLVTPFTSLVAVERARARIPSEPLAARRLMSLLPQEATFGLARTATPATPLLLAGAILLGLAAALGLARRRARG